MKPVSFDPLRNAPMVLKVLLITLLLAGLSRTASASDLRSIVVLDFDLQDDTAIQGGPVDTVAQERRLGLINAALRKELIDRKLYRVIDNAPAAQRIAETRKQQDLHACNGCERDIARELGGERVMVCWVDKVSNLIININIGVTDVETGKKLLIRSADVRGNTDDSWLRAIRRLAGEIEEKGLHKR
jgi:hypothetical protein